MKYCLLLPLLIFLSDFTHAKGNALIDSLLGELPRSAEDTNKVSILEELSFAYSTVNPDEGIRYGLMGVELAEKLRWERGIAASHAGVGVNYKAKSDYSKAFRHQLRALQLYRQSKNKKGEAAMLANISLIFSAQSDYANALDYAFKALKMNEELDNKPRLAIIRENIGTFYSEQKNYYKAMEYYRQAADIYRELDDKGGMARNTGNIGRVLDAQGNYQKALQHHQEALRVNEELGNKYGTLINLANIGIVYLHMHRYSEALRYQMQALSLSQEFGSLSNIAINLGNIGITYYTVAQRTFGEASPDSRVQLDRAANLRLSIRYLGQADSLCKSIGFSAPLVEFSHYLSEAYRASGDYQAALKYYKQHADLKDSVYSFESHARINNLQTQREIDIRDRNLLIKDKQLKISELEVAQKQNQLMLYGVSLLLLLLILGFVLKNYISYRESHSLLSREKMEYLQLIEEQIGFIKEHSKVLEEIAYMQAHDIRGPVATILGLTELFNKDDLADPSNREVVEGIETVAQKLDAAVQEVIRKENRFRREK